MAPSQLKVLSVALLTVEQRPIRAVNEQPKEEIMKLPPPSLCLVFCLSVTSVAFVTSFTGCVAGDPYHRSTGEYIDDKSMVSRVKDALGANAEYKFEGVQVAAFKGKVQLSGFVNSYAQKYAASSIAQKVHGVRDVQDNITVKSDQHRSLGEFIDDKALTSRVNRALGDSGDYKFGEVNVLSLQGTVQLSGFVNTVDQKAMAGSIASQVPGVQKVVNNITVKDKL